VQGGGWSNADSDWQLKRLQHDSVKTVDKVVQTVRAVLQEEIVAHGQEYEKMFGKSSAQYSEYVNMIMEKLEQLGVAPQAVMDWLDKTAADGSMPDNHLISTSIRDAQSETIPQIRLSIPLGEQLQPQQEIGEVVSPLVNAGVLPFSAFPTAQVPTPLAAPASFPPAITNWHAAPDVDITIPHHHIQSPTVDTVASPWGVPAPAVQVPAVAPQASSWHSPGPEKTEQNLPIVEPSKSTASLIASSWDDDSAVASSPAAPAATALQTGSTWIPNAATTAPVQPIASVSLNPASGNAFSSPSASAWGSPQPSNNNSAPANSSPAWPTNPVAQPTPGPIQAPAPASYAPPTTPQPVQLSLPAPPPAPAPVPVSVPSPVPMPASVPIPTQAPAPTQNSWVPPADVPAAVESQWAAPQIPIPSPTLGPRNSPSIMTAGPAVAAPGPSSTFAGISSLPAFPVVGAPAPAPGPAPTPAPGPAPTPAAAPPAAAAPAAIPPSQVFAAMPTPSQLAPKSFTQQGLPQLNPQGQPAQQQLVQQQPVQQRTQPTQQMQAPPQPVQPVQAVQPNPFNQRPVTQQGMPTPFPLVQAPAPAPAPVQPPAPTTFNQAMPNQRPNQPANQLSQAFNQAFSQPPVQEMAESRPSRPAAGGWPAGPPPNPYAAQDSVAQAAAPVTSAPAYQTQSKMPAQAPAPSAVQQRMPVQQQWLPQQPAGQAAAPLPNSPQAWPQQTQKMPQPQGQPQPPQQPPQQWQAQPSPQQHMTPAAPPQAQWQSAPAAPAAAPAHFANIPNVAVNNYVNGNNGGNGNGNGASTNAIGYPMQGNEREEAEKYDPATAWD